MSACVPVSLTDFLELVGDEAGEQRAHTTSVDEGFCSASHPHVDVAGRSVQLQEPSRQVHVVQYLSQLCLVAWLGQPTVLTPRVVA